MNKVFNIFEDKEILRNRNVSYEKENSIKEDLKIQSIKYLVNSDNLSKRRF